MPPSAHSLDPTSRRPAATTLPTPKAPTTTTPAATPTPTSGSSASMFTATPVYACLNAPQATNIVNAFKYLLANPKAANFASTANALFSNSFTDTSDSINQITGAAPGSVTFDSKAAFISGSGSQPPLFVDTLDFFWSCNAIAWRWVSTSGVGDDKVPVKGIDTFYINSQGQINSVYAEFNSGGFLEDLGYPECASN